VAACRRTFRYFDAAADGVGVGARVGVGVALGAALTLGATETDAAALVLADGWVVGTLRGVSVGPAPLGMAPPNQVRASTPISATAQMRA